MLFLAFFVLHSFFYLSRASETVRKLSLTVQSKIFVELGWVRYPRESVSSPSLISYSGLKKKEKKEENLQHEWCSTQYATYRAYKKLVRAIFGMKMRQPKGENGTSYGATKKNSLQRPSETNQNSMISIRRMWEVNPKSQKVKKKERGRWRVEDEERK